jgi:hypothetical protein
MAYYIDYFPATDSEGVWDALNIGGGATPPDLTGTGQSRITSTLNGNNVDPGDADVYAFKAEGSVTVTTTITNVGAYAMAPGWEAPFVTSIYDIFILQSAQGDSELFAPDTGLTVETGVNHTTYSFTMNNLVKEVDNEEVIYYLDILYNYGPADYEIVLDFGSSDFWDRFIYTEETV